MNESIFDLYEPSDSIEYIKKTLLEFIDISEQDYINDSYDFTENIKSKWNKIQLPSIDFSMDEYSMSKHETGLVFISVNLCNEILSQYNERSISSNDIKYQFCRIFILACNLLRKSYSRINYELDIAIDMAMYNSSNIKISESIIIKNDLILASDRDFQEIDINEHISTINDSSKPYLVAGYAAMIVSKLLIEIPGINSSEVTFLSEKLSAIIEAREKNIIKTYNELESLDFVKNTDGIENEIILLGCALEICTNIINENISAKPDKSLIHIDLAKLFCFNAILVNNINKLPKIIQPYVKDAERSLSKIWNKKYSPISKPINFYLHTINKNYKAEIGNNLIDAGYNRKALYILIFVAAIFLIYIAFN